MAAKMPIQKSIWKLIQYSGFASELTASDFCSAMNVMNEKFNECDQQPFFFFHFWSDRNENLGADISLNSGADIDEILVRVKLWLDYACNCTR